MAEGSRDYEESTLPEIRLSILDFPDVKNIQFGEKGSMEISGIIIGEREEEESKNILKTLQLLNGKFKREVRI
jgi:hypothetical protein